MLKSILILIIGLIAGIGIVTGVSVFVFHNMFWQGAKIPQTQQIAQLPSSMPPTPTPAISPQSMTQQYNEKVNNLKNQLYQQGINITSKVFQVYPAIGFILQDTTGTKMFAYWTQTQPQVGQNVTVLGTIARLSDSLTTLKNTTGYTTDLDTFLKNQTIFIEVKEIK